MKVSREEFRRIKKLAAERKAKRAEKRASLPWGDPPGIADGLDEGPWTKGKTIISGGRKWVIKRRPKIRQRSQRQEIKDQIVRELGLLDKIRNGPFCRIGLWCPAHKDVGVHPGQVAYHLIPQMRGDAARFVPENVVWACSRANRGEQKNRSLYDEKHIEIFGKDRIDKIKAIARWTADFSDADLVEKLAEVRRMIQDAKGGLR